MTTRTYRALDRVRHAARRLVAAVGALRPQDWREMPWWFRTVTLPDALRYARLMDRRLTNVLGPDKPKKTP